MLGNAKGRSRFLASLGVTTDPFVSPKKLEGEQCAGEFAFIRARFHYRRKDGDFHAESTDGGFLRRVAAVDYEGACEIGIKLGNRRGGGSAAELDKHFVAGTL